MEDGFFYVLVALEALLIALLIYGVGVKVSKIWKKKDLTNNPT